MKHPYIKPCEYCKKNFKGYHYNKFCCVECRNKYNKKNKVSISPLRNRWLCFVRDGFKCVYCGRGLEDGIKLECDHLISKKDGGKEELKNLVCSCRDCNRGKGKDSIDKNLIFKFKVI